MISQRRLDSAFTVLELLAANGDRCLTRDQGMPPKITTALARAGKIKVEVFRLNFKVVTILVGPHRGKTTAHGGKPYLIIDINGTWSGGHRIGGALPRPTARALRAEDEAIRGQPSAPRILTSEEIASS